MVQRRPTMEQCEPRILLTTNGFHPSDGISDSNFQAQPPFAEVSTISARETFQASDNSSRTATDLGLLDTAVSIRNQYVGTFDERDVFRFQMERSGETTIKLDGLSADADLFLLDLNRQTIGSSQNPGRSSDGIQVQLDAGEYFVVVQNYGFWSGTNYDLTLQAKLEPEIPADTVGNSFRTAFDVGSLRGVRSFAEYVGTNDALDIYRFQVDATTRLQVELSGLTADADLYLHAANGTRLVRSDAPETSTERIDGWLAAGTYYLAVASHNSANSNYSLTLQSGLPDTSPVSPPASSPMVDPPAQDLPVTPTVPPASETPPAVPPTAAPVPEENSSPTLSSPLASVPYFGSSRDWGVNSVNAPEAWSAGYTGEGITVAVIDSGVQLNHADLVGNLWLNEDEIPGDGIDNDRNGYIDDVRGWDFVGSDANPTDGNGHGTHVAGIIAAANNGVGGTGVAYASSIMPIRALDDNGSGSTVGVANGIRYAVDNGAHIINLSLGGGNSRHLYNALRYAEQNNVLVVAASGNESAGIPGYPAAHSATLSNVLSVGAYSSSNRHASFSNHVGTSDSVQVDAPGQGIFSTYIGGRYTSLSGTSMAAPFVSAVAALAWAEDPTLPASAIRNAITQSVGVAPAGSDSLGRVNAAAAIPLALSGSLSATTQNSVVSQASNQSQRVFATRFYNGPFQDDRDRNERHSFKVVTNIDFDIIGMPNGSAIEIDTFVPAEAAANIDVAISEIVDELFTVETVEEVSESQVA